MSTFFYVLAALYLVSPIDAAPGVMADDLIVCLVCFMIASALSSHD